jgi:hypothetical protein
MDEASEFLVIPDARRYLYREKSKNMESPKKPQKLFKHPDLELYRPNRVTWVGFIVAWVIVIAIITVTLFLARIGS